MSEIRFGSSMPSLGEILEALFFASDEPLPVKQVLEIIQLLDDGERPRRVSEEIILETVRELNESYEKEGRSFRIVKVAGGYQFATLPRFATLLGKMVRERSKRKLSQASLESLAVIAYKQPVTKPELEAIRGVNADYVVRSLLERDLITIVGRAVSPGRPLLYGTTRHFLKHFGLNDLSELPKPREIDELLAEADFEVEKRMLEELEGKQAERTTENPGVVVSEDGRLRGLPQPPETLDLSGQDEGPSSPEEK
jgi:segregation and condensation protein B